MFYNPVPYKDPERQRAAIRAHYEANKEAYNARAAERVKQQRLAARQHLINAKNRPCADCGVKYPPYVMQFDHLSDKKFGIAAAVSRGYSLAKIKAEIEKCEVVCANCHAERTHRRLRPQEESNLRPAE